MGFFTRNLKMDIRQGLVGHWKFHERDGIVTLDSSGNGNHGTLINGPIRGQGMLSKALIFDGVDDYVQFSNDFFSGRDKLTVSFWINVPTFNQGTYIGTAINDGGPNYGTSFGVTNSYQGYSNTFSCSLRINGGAVIITVQQSNFLTNRWYHYVAVYDGTQTGNANRIKIYIDNIQYSLSFDEPTVQSPLFTASGNSRMASASSLGAYFTGSLEDVRIYNTRALDPQEILILFNQGKYRINS